MELLLRITYRTPSGASATDVSIELEPSTSVELLRLALEEHARAHGLSSPVRGLGVLHGDAVVPLDDAATVFDARIVTGQELCLLDGDAAVGRFVGADAAPFLSLDVTSGPRSGYSVPLAPGRYLVGRHPGADVIVDDPAVSRRQLVLEIDEGLAARVAPHEDATTPTFIMGGRLDASRPLNAEEPLSMGDTQVVLRRTGMAAIGERDRLGQVAFNRLPYRRPVVRERTFDDLDAPPEATQRRRLGLVAMLVPAAGSVGIAFMTGRLEFLLFSALTPLMMLSTHFAERRESTRTGASDRAEWVRAVDARRAELREALLREREERFAASPDLLMLTRHAALRGSRLWERPRGSPDFLELRLGLGESPSKIVSGIQRGGERSLREAAIRRLAFHEKTDAVPVTLSLESSVVSGIHGGEAATRLVRSLVVQAAALHSPEDVVIAAAVPTADRPAWDWLKWLPHTRSATSPLEGPHLVTESGVGDLLTRLMKVVRDRKEKAAHDRTGAEKWPRVLLLLHEDAEAPGPALSMLLDNASAAGIVALWAGSHDHMLPRQCRAVVAVGEAWGSGTSVTFTDPDLDARRLEIEGASQDLAGKFARSLAPVRDVSAPTATTGIPRVVPLLDALGLPAGVEGSAIAARWAAKRKYGLECTLGVGVGGPWSIDLVSQGPHMLIAGTTGAGKSELLQSLVLALAAEHSPERLNFLFVDYKGGAATSELRGLPHEVGTVTNLDERMSQRAIESLQAERHRRMALLKDRAKDLETLLEVAPGEAPPSLVIVIDEFGTLVRQLPKFVDGLVDVAQQGRSLGIHLILATQRPEGVVNENILANTNLKIALRVLRPEDSLAVVGTRTAADIPVPLRGRAIARTGPSVSTFQCAWAGAPLSPRTEVPVVVRAFSYGPPEACAPAPQSPAKSIPRESHLDAVLRACNDAFLTQGLEPSRPPWVEPLLDVIPLSSLPPDPALTRLISTDPGRYVVVGRGDSPAEQTQLNAACDLEGSGGLIIFGGGGSGKTTALRTIAAGLSQQGSPDDVRLYVLDFGGRSLLPLEELPHTACVATADNLERVTRMLSVLLAEMDRRSQLLGDARADTLSAARASGTVDLPRLIILLDSYAAFHSAFEEGPLFPWLTALQRLVGEGRRVGIHVVLTALREVGMPSVITSSVRARIVLRTAVVEDMIALGVPRHVAADAVLPSGRGFMDGTVEVQIAVVSEDPAAPAQARAISELARSLGDQPSAPRLPELPDDLILSRRTAPSFRCSVGRADLTLDEVMVDVSRGHFVVVGPARSGRSTVLATVAEGLALSTPDILLTGLGPPSSPLAAMKVWDIAAFSRAGHSAAIAEAWRAVEGDEGGDVKVVLVIDPVELLEEAGHDEILDKLLRSDAVRAVVAHAPSLRAFGGWKAALKQEASFLVLAPGSGRDVESIANVGIALRPGQPFPPGRGVFVDGGTARLVQVGRYSRPE